MDVHVLSGEVKKDDALIAIRVLADVIERAQVTLEQRPELAGNLFVRCDLGQRPAGHLRNQPPGNVILGTGFITNANCRAGAFIWTAVSASWNIAPSTTSAH